MVNRKKKRKLWHHCLTKAEKQHLKEYVGCSLVSKEPFLRSIRRQRELQAECQICNDIARKLGV